jgi:ribosomal protein S12
MREFMKNFKRDNSRCVYENDDILITNDTMTDVSGDKVVVVMVHLKKEGQIWRTEMGETQQK